MLPNCPKCNNQRWLCTEHEKPWGHDDCKAEGERCECNQSGPLEMPEGFKKARMKWLSQQLHKRGYKRRPLSRSLTGDGETE